MDLVSIEFNTPPNEGEGSAILPNEMSSINAEPDQTTSVFDHQIPSATRNRESTNFNAKQINPDLAVKDAKDGSGLAS